MSTSENVGPLQKEMGSKPSYLGYGEYLRYSVTFLPQCSVTGAPPTLPQPQAGTGEMKTHPLWEIRAKTIYRLEGVQGHLWVGRNFKGHTVPRPLPWAEHLPLDRLLNQHPTQTIPQFSKTHRTFTGRRNAVLPNH